MAGNENKRKAIEKIEEFIKEENKIVIYKWLSRTLSVDVDTAKDYLNCFVEENKSRYPINVCYLLSGTQEIANDRKVHKVIVTSENKLEHSKSLFSTLTSFHVYSVQLSKIQDASILYTAEVVSNSKPEDQQMYSGVKYDKVRILPKRKSFEAKTSEQNNVTKSEQKGSAKLQPLQSKQKQNGLFTLWQKQSGSSKTEKKENEVKPIKSLFTDGSVKRVHTTEVEKATVENEDLKAKKSSKEDERENERRVPSRKENSRKTERKIPSKLSRKWRKHDQEHLLSDEETEKKPNKKKHRRIMQISDSESEVEDELSEEELDVHPKRLKICEENLEENILEEDKESPIPERDNSTVSYKTVNKTFIDEQGFMVTKKVKECVRESPKKEEKPVAQEKKSMPSVNSKEAQKKQASLMSFFKRK